MSHRCCFPARTLLRTQACHCDILALILISRHHPHTHVLPSPSIPPPVVCTISNFLGQSLLVAAQQLLGGAIGSFGLCLTHSLDSERECVLAAR